jgi:hypothetical protein
MLTARWWAARRSKQKTSSALFALFDGVILATIRQSSGETPAEIPAG